jgi:hypothetical protein
MNRFLSLLFLTLALFNSPHAKAQVSQILYSEPEREDGRRTNFEIIGKLNDNYLVFKNTTITTPSASTTAPCGCNNACR